MILVAEFMCETAWKFNIKSLLKIIFRQVTLSHKAYNFRTWFGFHFDRLQEQEKENLTIKPMQTDAHNYREILCWYFMLNRRNKDTHLVHTDRWIRVVALEGGRLQATRLIIRSRRITSYAGTSTHHWGELTSVSWIFLNGAGLVRKQDI